MCPRNKKKSGLKYKTMLEDLLRERDSLGNIFNAMAGFVFILDTKLRFIRANKTFSDFVKIKPDKLIGKNCYKILHKSNNSWKSCPALKTLKDKKVHMQEINDPAIGVPLMVTTSPIFDDKGKISGVVHICVDISAIKKSEETIRQQKIFLENIINAIGHSLYVINPDYTVALANSAARKRGIVEGGICYRTSHRRNVPCSGEYKCPLSEVIRTKKPVKLEHEHYDKQGDVRMHEIHGEPIFDENGEVAQMIEYTIDVTEYKMQEAMLKEAYGKLQETQSHLIQAEKMSAVGKIASGIAHEVKNPLHLIIQGVNYLEREIGHDKGKQSEVLDIIKNAVEKSDRIIKGLLNFVRMSPLEFKFCEINKVIETSLNLAGERLDLKGIRIVKDFGSSLPLVEIDADQMEHVFINIVLNSICAMPEGGKLFIRTYAAGITELKNDRRHVAGFLKEGERALICEIEDTGAGISKDNLTKVFDPFFTTSPAGEGSGLGLSIAASIVNSHNGLITIESKIGKWTKVTIALPVNRGG